MAHRWAWEPPEELSADDSLDLTLDGDLTSIEKAFARWVRNFCERAYYIESEPLRNLLLASPGGCSFPPS